MAQIGYAAMLEQFHPKELVGFCEQAEAAGFSGVMAADHVQPWVPQQGQASFVWSFMTAAAEHTRGDIGPGVTCPSFRSHPAIIAQAAATMAALYPSRFWLGLGSGEALNEHIVAEKWPEASVRLEMLEEAVAILRRLWQGGDESHYGTYFEMENARIYTLPGTPPPIYVSAFGPKSIALAARIGDGLVSTKPDADLLRSYTDAGGRGPKLAQVKVCWDDDGERARDLAFHLWPTSGLEGELSQELPTPRHFEQAVSVLKREDVVSSFPCGRDPQPHLDAIRKYADSGYDEVYITQVGPNQEGFLRFYEREILPEFQRQRSMQNA